MSSRLSDAACRLRVAAGILNNTTDIALIHQYADELESLAARAGDLMQSVPDDSIDGQVEAIKSCLKKAFPVPPGMPFNGLLIMLDEENWKDQSEYDPKTFGPVEI